MTKTPILFSEDGTLEIELPFRWEICSFCEGRGTSSAYLGAFTQDEMDEQGPEFFEDYMAGNYDRACDCCGGSGKIKVADRRKMTRAQIREYDAQLQADAEYEAEVAAERRMGC